MSIPKVGDRIKVWCAGTPDNIAGVLRVEPYRGMYRDVYTHTLTVTAARTRRGEIELCVHEKDYEPEEGAT